MTSTDYREADRLRAVDKPLTPRFDSRAPKPISSDRLLGITETGGQLAGTGPEHGGNSGALAGSGARRLRGK